MLERWLDRPAACVAALFGLVFFLLYTPHLVHGLMFYSADNYAFGFIGHKYWFETWHRSGSPQFWNPYVNLGTSFLFNPTWGVLYPPNLIQLFVPSEISYRTLWIAHLILLAAGLYRWATNAGASREARVLIPVLVAGAGVSQLFSVSQVFYLYLSAWSAWILAELDHPSPSRASALRLLAFWGLLVTNGETFSIFMMGIVIASHIVVRREWKLLAAFGAVSAVLYLAVFGHAQLVLPYSTRAAGVDEEIRLQFSFHPLRLLTLLSPYFFGHPVLTPGKAGPEAVAWWPRYFFDTAYLPLPVLLLGWAGLLAAIRRRAWLWLGLCALALLLLFGQWGLLGVAGDLPLFRFLRSPEKLLCVTALLFAGLAVRYGKLEEIRVTSPAFLPLFLAAAVVPWFADPMDPWTALASLSIAAAFLAREKGRIGAAAMIAIVLAAGIAQCRLSFPPQRVLLASRAGELGPIAQTILKTLPDGDSARFEFGVGISGMHLPHQDLQVGTYMAHRRASVFAYESVESPLIAALKTRFFAAPEPLPTEGVRDLLRLTSLQLLIVANHAPMTSLLQAVQHEGGLFEVRERAEKWTALIAKEPPSPLWWFPRLERGSFSEEDPLVWPPRVSVNAPFLGGIQRSAESAEPAGECGRAGFKPVALGSGSFSKRGEDHYELEFEVPCEGWVFFSQHLYPGWTLASNGRERPLYPMNGSLIGFQVPAGNFRGTLAYRPWKALWESLWP